MYRRHSPGRLRRTANGAEVARARRDVERSWWTAHPRTSASAESHRRQPAPGWFHWLR